jgi:hypothetical protein
MLLKKPNTFHVSKLRAILLFEADFNHNNKRLGRTPMHHAEDQNWIAIATAAVTNFAHWYPVFLWLIFVCDIFATIESTNSNF